MPVCAVADKSDMLEHTAPRKFHRSIADRIMESKIRSEISRLMVRRCKTLVLLMAYLASQVAAMPHAHGASDSADIPSDHDACPHVHVFWCGHTHGHCNEHQHHHHEHGAADSHGLRANSNYATDEQSGHDNDAAYLADDLAGPQLQPNVTQCAGPDQSPAHTVSVSPTVSSEATFSTRALLPQECRSDGALYLALRTLRI